MKKKPRARTEGTEPTTGAPLIEQMHAVEQELKTLTGGGIDAIAGADGVPFLSREDRKMLHLQESAQRQAAEMQMAILNALPAHIALLNTEGVILAVNEAWRRFASANVLQGNDFHVGQNYLGACESAHGVCAEEAQAAADGIRSVLRGKTQEFSLEYPCHSPTEKCWFRLMVTPLNEHQMAGVVVMHVNVTHRRRAEEILRENQQRLEIEAARLHESQLVACVGSWETDLSTLEVIWTGQTHRIFETSPDYFSPSHEGFLERVHPDDRAAVDEAFLQSLDQTGPFAIEHRLLMPDGRIKFVEERWRVFHDETGKPIRAIGTCQDITERKLAADSIAQGQLLLRIAGQAARLGGWSLEIPDYQLTWSDETFLIHDMPVGSVPTLEEAIRFYPPESREEVSRQVKLCAEEGEPFDFEMELITAKQRRIWVRAIGEAVRDEKNQIIRVQGAFQDISQQKAAEEAARSAGARLLDTVESITDGLFTVDREWRFTYVNAEAERLLGCDRSSLLGRSIWEAYPPAVGTVFEEEYRRAVAEYRTTTFEEYYPPLDMWIEVKAYPSADGLAVYFRDVSERKRMETALAEKTRALELLSRCNEALIRSETEMGLLEGICQCAVDVGGFQRAWVGYAMDDEDKTIFPKASVGAEDGYLAEITISWDEESPNGQGPAGRSIRCGLPTVIPDLESDGSFRPWLTAAKASGIRGVICLPLKDATRTFGVLGLHLAEVRHPQPDEMHVLQELADDMAFGIINLRERHTRQRTQTALVNVAAAVSATTGRQFFEQLAGNMAQALGAHAGFVAQCVPGELLSARTIAAVVDGRPTDNFDYILEGTPCESLVTSETCIISTDVAQQFPHAPRLTALGAKSYVGRRLDSSSGKFLGLLFVLFREPLQEADLVTAMLQIFAARAASELERQETDARVHEQAALLDKARDAIFVRDLNHEILYWNQSAERLYGWSAAEALGRTVQELIYRDPHALDAPFAQLMASDEWAGELEQVTKDGKVVIVDGHCSLVRDELGKPKSVLSINTDITERKMIEAQYLRAQRMESIGTLAGGIAHDLNNVLAPIMMSIELLKMREQNPLRLEILATIEGSAKRGADMVMQVLSFARGVEGRQLEVHVGHLLKEIQKIVQDTFLKNIEVRGKFPSDLWLVQGDPTQLHQVLLNLCVNARDAMPDGGTLTLSAGNLTLDEHFAGLHMEAKPGPHVCIGVEDSGTGMPPEIMDRIFEPFFTTKELDKGTGLGLSTSIAIIRSHGGFVRVYSEIGMGSRFHVYLPAHSGPGVAKNDTAPVELPRGKGELVLVVDDEPAVRQITRQTLEAFGYRVVLASDGVEATSIYATRKEEIAVVITDMMMPLMDGPATIQVLLKLNPQARIIAASGLNANAMVAKSTNAGIKHFLPKPYTAETLLKTMRDVLEA